MIARLLLQSTITTAAMGALLFASAGTLHWPSAWVFLATSALLGPLCGWWLYRVDPALLAERLRPVLQKDQPACRQGVHGRLRHYDAGLAGGDWA